MLSSHDLLALAASSGERSHFAERCYASACQALDEDESQRAALLFALVALSRPTDFRAWLGLSRAARELEHAEAAVGLEEIAAALSAQAETMLPERTLLRRIWP
jgi:hypothetical protein